jgi:NTP pyrophosphatase (non-canonical NTP hydrolase)
VNELEKLNVENFEKKNLSQIQKDVDDYISQFKVGYFPPMSQMVRMTEEVGELAREVMDEFGEKKKKSTEASGTIAEELTDVFVVTLMLANSLGIDLTESFEKNMDKFYKRDSHRFERVDENK